MVAATQRRSARLVQAWSSRGPLARALWPVAALFGLIAALRRGLYAIGCLRAQPLTVPVVVVGNLVAGGAGKTPTVMALVNVLRSQGRRPGVISRGYRRTGHGVLEVTNDTPVALSGDEALLMRIRLGVPVVVGRDRVAAARELLRRHPGVDVIVSDDGLQHLRLPRAVQVLVFDDRGAGNGWLLPAGPLREPLPADVPPRTLVLYNADQPSTPLPGSLATRCLAGLVSLPDWWAGAPAALAALHGLRGQAVVAAAGMAHPDKFFEMLRGAGLTIEPMPLPDHFDFAALPWPPDTRAVVVTEKDAVKLQPQRMGETRVWVAPLDFQVDARFAHDLMALLPATSTRTPDGHPTA